MVNVLSSGEAARDRGAAVDTAINEARIPLLSEALIIFMKLLRFGVDQKLGSSHLRV
jgi:hypothetical protein